LRRAARTEVNVPMLDTATFVVDSAAASPGTILNYTARLTNTGTATATASLTDALPSPLSYVPGSAWASVGYVDVTDNVVTWAGSLLPGDAVTVHLAAQVPLIVPNGLLMENTARIYDGWHPMFTRSATTVAQAPDLEPSSKTADRLLAQPGDAITYTIVIANAGDWPAAGATLSDTLPVSTTYVAGSVTGGATYDLATHAITWNGGVNAGATRTITYRVTVDLGPDRGTTFVNQAILDDGRGLITVRQSTVTVPFRTYFPIVAHSG
jgi:uncharacterized repeat protein (TIGR01451 family)